MPVSVLIAALNELRNEWIKDRKPIELMNEVLVKLIEKVTVYEDKFTVEFKSGVTVDVDE